MIKYTNDYIIDYRYRDKQGNDLSDDETIIFLDLTKIESVLEKTVDKMTNLEMWAVFLKYVTDDSKKDILNQIVDREAGVKMANEVLIEVSRDEETRAYYESELIFQLDQNGKIAQAVKEAEAKFEIQKKEYESEIQELQAKIKKLENKK